MPPSITPGPKPCRSSTTCSCISGRGSGSGTSASSKAAKSGSRGAGAAACSLAACSLRSESVPLKPQAASSRTPAIVEIPRMISPCSQEKTARPAKGSLPQLLGEGAHRFGLFPRPDRGADREEIRPGLDQRRAVVGRDPADGDAGDLHQSAPPLQQFGIGMVLARFGRAREEGAESDVIAPPVARFHGEMPAGVAGHADLRFAPERLARLAHSAVVLAEMDAIGLEALSQRYAVIDDEGDLALAA